MSDEPVSDLLLPTVPRALDSLYIAYRRLSIYLYGLSQGTWPRASQVDAREETFGKAGFAKDYILPYRVTTYASYATPVHDIRPHVLYTSLYDYHASYARAVCTRMRVYALHKKGSHVPYLRHSTPQSDLQENMGVPGGVGLLAKESLKSTFIIESNRERKDDRLRR